jgi:phosphate transport system substrate-binding protein
LHDVAAVTGPLHPIASAIRSNIGKALGKPLDPWLNAYCEFLLSEDAQQVNGSPQIRQVGFRRPHPGETESELMKLQ